MNLKPVEQGAIQLDNQSIVVRILMPSGRFQVTDKVSGMVWSMQQGHASGAAVLRHEQHEKTYRFGIKGKNGVLFQSNYYMIRSTATDDVHDVMLTGDLGDQTDTQITLRYLLSVSFPVLNCFCYGTGKRVDQFQTIQFPLGFRLPGRDQSRLYLPQNIKTILEKPASGQKVGEELWQPAQEVDHKVAGAPFFALTRRQSNRASGCIGYVQHPLSVLDICRKKNDRFVHPSSSRLEETGKREEKPYFFRYQFVPTDDLEALSWLYKEYLMGTEQTIHL